jgi:hypothetical protein
MVGRAVLCPPPIGTNVFGFTTTMRNPGESLELVTLNLSLVTI